MLVVPPKPEFTPLRLKMPDSSLFMVPEPAIPPVILVFIVPLNVKVPVE